MRYLFRDDFHLDLVGFCFCFEFFLSNLRFFRLFLIDCLELCLNILVLYGQDLKISFNVLFCMRKDFHLICEPLAFYS